MSMDVENQSPALTIFHPYDGFLAAFPYVRIAFGVSDASGLRDVTININDEPGQSIIDTIDPETGRSEGFIAPKGGINTITVTATDLAGNTASRTVRGLHLVFDRTEADVLDSTQKGFYNASDLNRVGEAEADLAALCRALGNTCAVSPKTDWSLTDIPTQAQMQTFIGHLNAFKALFPYPGDMPPVPADMHHLDWQRANDIEELLYRWFEMVQSIRDSWFYAGEIFTGEVI